MVEHLRVNSPLLIDVCHCGRVVILYPDDLTEQGLLQIDQHQPNNSELQNIDMELAFFMSA